MYGGGGDDALFGEDGSDELHGDNQFGPSDIGGNDKLFGGPGDDKLNGQVGHDVLFGNAGKDRLSGGDGSDYLNSKDNVVNNDPDVNGGAGTDICKTDPDSKQNCELAALISINAAIDILLPGQSNRISLDASEVATLSTIRDWRVLEPDGDQCVDPTMEGVQVRGGTSLVNTYPGDYVLARDDDRTIGNNLCDTVVAIRAIYRLRVLADVAPVDIVFQEVLETFFTVSADTVDNCPEVSNPDQADLDSDGLGDACDPENTVRIDIKPGSDFNLIDLSGPGMVRVAIITQGAFNAASVNPLSVTFDPRLATEVHRKGHLRDVDNDGDMDMLLHFDIQATGIACGDRSATLHGELLNGIPIIGSDSIQTVGCQ